MFDGAFFPSVNLLNISVPVLQDDSVSLKSVNQSSAQHVLSISKAVGIHQTGNTGVHNSAV